MADRLEFHQKDYLEGSWRIYEIDELGSWVHLFHKRASHRANIEKAKKDLYDAKNYLWMMEQKLKNRAETLGIVYEEL